MTNINTSYTYQGDITNPEKETIIDTVKYNLANKMAGYLEKFKKNPDTEVNVKITIEKNAREGGARYGFNGVFVLNASGSDSLRYERENFNDLRDLIHHAFDHFKEALASK